MVLLVPPIPEPGEGLEIEDVILPDVYLQAFTNDEGSLDEDVSLPIDVEEVDLVVDLADSTGDYTDEALRDRWGPLAPSSRTTHSVDDLGSITIALETE